MGPLLSWFPAKMAEEGGILILISADQKNPLADQNMWGRQDLNFFEIRGYDHQSMTKDIEMLTYQNHLSLEVPWICPLVLTNGNINHRGTAR